MDGRIENIEYEMDLKNPPGFSHTNFKINPEGKLCIRSLLFNKRKCNCVLTCSGERTSVSTFSHRNRDLFYSWGETSCSNRIWLAGLEYYSQLCLWPMQNFKDTRDFCCCCQVHGWHQGSALLEASNPCVGASRDWRCQCALDLAGSCVYSL